MSAPVKGSITLLLMCMGSAEVFAQQSASGANYPFTTAENGRYSITVRPVSPLPAGSEAAPQISCPAIGTAADPNGKAVVDVSLDVKKILPVPKANEVNGSTEYNVVFDSEGRVGTAVVYFDVSFLGSSRCRGSFKFEREKTTATDKIFELVFTPASGEVQTAELPAIIPPKGESTPRLFFSQDSRGISQSSILSAIQLSMPSRFSYQVVYQNEYGAYTDGYRVTCSFVDASGTSTTVLDSTTDTSGRVTVAGTLQPVAQARPAGQTPPPPLVWDLNIKLQGREYAAGSRGDSMLTLSAGQPIGSVICTVPADERLGKPTLTVQQSFATW